MDSKNSVVASFFQRNQCNFFFSKNVFVYFLILQLLKAPLLVISVSADPSCKLDRLGIQLEHFDVTTSRIMLLFFLEGIIDYLDVMTSIHRRKLLYRANACNAPAPMTLWCVSCSLDRYTLQMQRLILLIMATYSREYKITKLAIDLQSKKDRRRMKRAKKIFLDWKRMAVKK